MCRKGRMFAPTKTWRRWHRKISINQRRYAVVSAVAATAVPSLVLARGHRIEKVNEIPLVVSSKFEQLSKTKAAIELLKNLNAYVDVEKVKDSRKIRAGKGKMRNRRYTQRRGPLIIYEKDDGIVAAFRNLPGVELASVYSLNLLTLAPVGHLGRFCLWTESAFSKLDSILEHSRLHPPRRRAISCLLVQWSTVTLQESLSLKKSKLFFVLSLPPSFTRLQLNQIL